MNKKGALAPYINPLPSASADCQQVILSGHFRRRWFLVAVVGVFTNDKICYFVHLVYYLRIKRIQVMTNLYFFTATILEWKHLLADDNYKDIILNSLSFLVRDKRIKVYSFVIMPNHLHLVWRVLEPHFKSDVQRDFLKFTAQKIKARLKAENPGLLEKFRVDAKDREYQIWERDPLSIDLVNIGVIEQKIDYVHSNPFQPKWNLGKTVTDYKYTSASFYYSGKDNFGFLNNIGEEYC